MRKLLITLALLEIANFTYAQDSLTIFKSNGIINRFDINDIDSISFKAESNLNIVNKYEAIENYYEYPKMPVSTSYTGQFLASRAIAHNIQNPYNFDKVIVKAIFKNTGTIKIYSYDSAKNAIWISGFISVISGLNSLSVTGIFVKNGYIGIYSDTPNLCYNSVISSWISFNPTSNTFTEQSEITPLFTIKCISTNFTQQLKDEVDSNLNKTGDFREHYTIIPDIALDKLVYVRTHIADRAILHTTKNPYDFNVAKVRIRCQTGNVKICSFDQSRNLISMSDNIPVATGTNEIKAELNFLKNGYVGIYSATAIISNTTSPTLGFYSTNLNTGASILDSTCTPLFTVECIDTASKLGVIKNYIDTHEDILAKTSDKNVDKENYNVVPIFTNNPLFIPTPWSLNEPYHPSVLYFANGWKGYEYWMVETPFPYNIPSSYRDRWECPSIVVSHDGKTWFEVKGMKNPVIDLTDIAAISGANFLSDPHLVYNSINNTIELFFRYSVSTIGNTSLYRTVCTDGINWSANELLLTFANDNTMLRSPAIILENGTYKMLSVYGVTAPYRVRYSTSSDCKNWTHTDCVLSNGSTSIWHLDFEKFDDMYYMLSYSLSSQVLELYKSTDCINWTFVKKMLSKTEGTFYNAGLYRSSLVKCGAVYRIYFVGDYSYNGVQKANIGYMEGTTLDNMVVKDGRNINLPVFEKGLIIPLTNGNKSPIFFGTSGCELFVDYNSGKLCFKKVNGEIIELSK